MKYCGIELKGDEARVIGVETKEESYSVITSGVEKFKIKDPSSQMEGIIQCMPFSISIINPATIRSKLKDTELDLADCKEYQIEALKVVLTMMVLPT